MSTNPNLSLGAIQLRPPNPSGPSGPDRPFLSRLVESRGTRHLERPAFSFALVVFWFVLVTSRVGCAPRECRRRCAISPLALFGVAPSDVCDMVCRCGGRVGESLGELIQFWSAPCGAAGIASQFGSTSWIITTIYRMHGSRSIQFELTT